MYVKQIRTKNNTYSTVQYDSLGNIITPKRRKELKELSKNKYKKNKKSPKWIKLLSKYDGICCVCNNDVSLGTEILWNKKNKKIKHFLCNNLS